MKVLEIKLKGICKMLRKSQYFLLVFFGLGIRNDVRFRILGGM